MQTVQLQPCERPRRAPWYRVKKRFARFRLIVIILGFLLAAVDQLRADSWPTDTRYSCDDFYVLKDTWLIRDWVPAKQSYVNALGNGNIIAQLSSRLFRNGQIKLGTPFQLDQRVLASADANFLISTIKRHVEVYNVPFYISNLPIPLLVASNVGNKILQTTIGLVRSGAVKEISSVKMTADQMTLFVVKGGQLLNLATVSAAKDRYLLSQEIVYSVAIGEERRSFIWLSCIYPANVNASRITTFRDDATVSHVFEESDDGSWIWIDPVAGRKKLTKTGEDAAYIYFDWEDACTNEHKSEGICIQLRVSKTGGGAATKWNSDTTWDETDHGGPIAMKSSAE